jgi:chemosensory pili system protein ChpA (sensor histidine kinase/response regulator)
MPPQRCVMLVEDTSAIRELLRVVLENEGHEVIAARDGQEALDLLETTTPDVILTDLEMPRLDGWQLITALRFDPVASPIPVVVVSAEIGTHTAEELGVRAVVHKPFSPVDLVRVLDSILG